MSKTSFRRSETAFTLAETLVATAAASLVLGGLIMTSVAMQRSFSAAVAYATAEGDQLRFSDYVALDCRRATWAGVANGVTINGISTDNVLTLTIPDYYNSYDANGNPYPSPDTSPAPSPASQPKNPTLVNNAVTYGGTALTIRYYAQGNRFYREQNGVATAIADNVAGFNITQQDLTSTVKCTITFTPKFIQASSNNGVAGSKTFTVTFLRNAGARLP
ncbi:MAG TPA: hypothetical protein VN827_09875 [Chthoniobacterales bacterium]|nr:hypothetical protein [Chthoniobacterales bacterium]